MRRTLKAWRRGGLGRAAGAATVVADDEEEQWCSIMAMCFRAPTFVFSTLLPQWPFHRQAGLPRQACLVDWELAGIPLLLPGFPRQTAAAL